MQTSGLSRALRTTLEGWKAAPPPAASAEGGAVWTTSLVIELLKEDHQASTEASTTASGATEELQDDLPERLPGVPSRPFYSAIARVISWWSVKGEPPFKHIPFPLLKEKPVYFERLEQMKGEIMALKGIWERDQDDQQRASAVADFLQVSLHDSPFLEFSDTDCRLGCA